MNALNHTPGLTLKAPRDLKRGEDHAREFPHPGPVSDPAPPAVTGSGSPRG